MKRTESMLQSLPNPSLAVTLKSHVALHQTPNPSTTYNPDSTYGTLRDSLNHNDLPLGVQFMPLHHRPWTTLAKISNWNRLQILRIESSGTKAKGTFDISLGITHEKVTLRK
jgi:hypothetical protein